MMTQKMTKNGYGGFSAAKLMSLTLAAVLVLSLGGCAAGGTKQSHSSGELSEEAKSAIEIAEQQRREYETDIRAEDVLAGKELKANTNYLVKFPDAPTEYLSDVVLYEDLGAEGRLPSYIFIAKIEKAEKTSDIQSILMDWFAEQPKMDDESIEIEVAVTNGYIIAAAADNASNIVNKYVAMTEDEMPESSQALYSMLSCVESR